MGVEVAEEGCGGVVAEDGSVGIGRRVWCGAEGVAREGDDKWWFHL